MSSASNTSSPISNFEILFNTALVNYSKYTGQDLSDYPLTAVINRCESPDEILAIFQAQSQAFDEFRNGDPKLISSLRPVVNGLHAISTNIVPGTGASPTFRPANVIFSGISVLLSAAKYVRQSYDTLVDIFESIGNFVSRLKIYSEIKSTPAMIETMIKLMAEMMAVLGLMTKQVNQGRLKKFATKLLGEKDVESVLQRLDRLTRDESRMTAAQTLDVVYGLVSNMQVVMEGGKASTDDIRETLVLMQEIVMKQNKIERGRLGKDIRAWLSPPDPWTNYNIARRAHHPGTATWFIQGDTFGKWKSTGSLLWVNGLPGSGKTILSSSIIEDIQDMCMAGLAVLAIFYFHFGDTTKQDARNLLSSVLSQLCYQSDVFSEVLSSVYSSHDHGSREPSIDTLLECLKKIIALQGQGPLYIVVDALDECPNSSGLRTQREEVLKILKELIELKLPHLHLCVTSRPEIDIRRVFDPLNPYNVSLHNQDGQIKDLAEFVKSVIGSDPKMQYWPTMVKELVIDTLAKTGGGMFRWTYYQLENLRVCPVCDVPSILNEFKLPETLDETPKRRLQGTPPTTPAPLITPSLVRTPPAHMPPTSSLLEISNTVLGRGSHGTVVYEGSFQGRAVAVKCLVREHVTLAQREVRLLKDADDHPNVIRYFFHEVKASFLCIALALCPASLADIIERPAHSDQFRKIADTFNCKRAVREITSGLGHLHSLRIVHRDIKPSNILISSVKEGESSGHRMLISDFGLCRELEFGETSYSPTVSGAIGAGTCGWKAPEILRREVRGDEAITDDNVRTTIGIGMQTRLTNSVDIFALGCLHYYCLTTGGHPFGNRHERDYNIWHGRVSLQRLEGLGEDGPEAVDLITSMLAPEAANRPNAAKCLMHPYFWAPGRRLEFLQDASDRFEALRCNQQDPVLTKLESNAINIVGRDWSERLDKILLTHVGKRRKYKKESVQELLRVVRNQKHHYQDLPKDVKTVVGPLPEGYLSYFTSRFPNLFLHVYSVITNSHLRQEDMFRSYFDLTD